MDVLALNIQNGNFWGGNVFWRPITH